MEIAVRKWQYGLRPWTALPAVGTVCYDNRHDRANVTLSKYLQLTVIYEGCSEQAEFNVMQCNATSLHEDWARDWWSSFGVSASWLTVQMFAVTTTTNCVCEISDRFISKLAKNFHFCHFKFLLLCAPFQDSQRWGESGLILFEQVVRPITDLFPHHKTFSNYMLKVLLFVPHSLNFNKMLMCMFRRWLGMSPVSLIRMAQRHLDLWENMWCGYLPPKHAQRN